MNTKSDVQLIFKCFQYCGLFNHLPMSSEPSNSSIKKSTLNKTISRISFIFTIWTYINIIFLFIIISIMWYLRDISFHSTSTIGRALDIAQVLSPIITHFVMLIETIYWQSNLSKIWTAIEHLDELTTKLNNNINNYNDSNKILLKRFTKKFFIINFIGLITETFIISSVYKTNFVWTRALLYRLWSFNVIRQGTLHLIFYIELIAHRFDFIIWELLYLSKMISIERAIIEGRKRRGRQQYQLASPMEYVKQYKTTKFIWLRLQSLKCIHNILWQMMLNVNYRFGWSLLINLLNIFFCVTIGFYFVYARLRFGQLTHIEQSLMCLVSPIVTTVILIMTCENCLQKVHNIGTTLHAIDRISIDLRISSMIQQYSTQILLEPFFISATKFFHINMEMLKDMIYAITTYLVICISMNTGTY